MLSDVLENYHYPALFVFSNESIKYYSGASTKGTKRPALIITISYSLPFRGQNDITNMLEL